MWINAWLSWRMMMIFRDNWNHYTVQQTNSEALLISALLQYVVNVWLPCPCHVVAPAILQSLIVPLCSPRSCCIVLAVSECNTAKCSFSAVCPPWEAFDQLRCCVCFRVSLLTCSAPWLSGVLSELKPGFLQIVFSRIRWRVHDKWPIYQYWYQS